LLGRSERVAEAIAEAIKIHRRGKKIEWPHLTADVKENIILVLVGKIPWVDRKITDF